MSEQALRRNVPPNNPRRSLAPYAGGIGVAVWLNTIETADGRRVMRSITIAPRRYRDRQTGEWKDSGSFRPSDIPILLVGLQKAMEFVYTTPLPATKEKRRNMAKARRTATCRSSSDSQHPPHAIAHGAFFVSLPQGANRATPSMKPTRACCTPPRLCRSLR